MGDLEKALADISAIRSQIAASAGFHGYGPAALAATGGLALITAAAQAALLEEASSSPIPFLAVWAAAAVLAVAIIFVEMLGRSRRHHSGLSDAMIYNAIEQFLPAGAAGALLALVFIKFATEALWMLPGLWQILVSLGIFASARSLPRSITMVGAWYFIAGLTVLMLASESHALSPWVMGVPFAIGQFLMALIVHLAAGENDGGN
jgi:hypothetical protein